MEVIFHLYIWLMFVVMSDDSKMLSKLWLTRWNLLIATLFKCNLSNLISLTYYFAPNAWPCESRYTESFPIWISPSPSSGTHMFLFCISLFPIFVSVCALHFSFLLFVAYLYHLFHSNFINQLQFFCENVTYLCECVCFSCRSFACRDPQMDLNSKIFLIFCIEFIYLCNFF